MELSDLDRALLRQIQSDASLSLAEIGERVGMAQSTVWRKLQDFEAAGLLKGRVALLDPALAGAKLCVFASVSLEDHSEESVAGFTSVVARHPEILECHAVSGTADYIVKIRVGDVEAYEHFMTHVLLRNPHVRAVVSSFSLKEIKYATALPL
ncbi:MAG: Lrp/AsnC family transcriptional regulator [Pseudomonadota bacterium]